MALGIVLVVAVMAFWPGGDTQVELGVSEDYALGAVVYRATDGFFVARQPDGTVLALSDVDPHNPPKRPICRVTFRPDLAADGESGRFFDNCTGSMYDIGGRGLSGDGLDLERLPVKQDNEGRLRVSPPR